MLPCRARAATPAPGRRSLFLLLERAGVDAVAQAGRLRAIGEDVPQMAAAAPAMHFGALHEMAAVGLRLDGVARHRGVEARPAGAGVELGVRIEERRATPGAHIGSRVVRVPKGSGEGTLGPLLAEHVVLQRRQLFGHGDRIYPSNWLTSRRFF